MKLLLVNTKRFLPPDMRKWAQDAKSLEELRNTLLDNARLWFDSMEAEEQVFSASQQRPGSEDKDGNNKTEKPICFGFQKKGFCRFGRRCRFNHVTNRNHVTDRTAQPQPQDRQEVSTGRELQLTSGHQVTRRQPYQVTRRQPYPNSNPRGIHLSSGRYMNPRRSFGPREVRLPPSINFSMRGAILEEGGRKRITAI